MTSTSCARTLGPEATVEFEGQRSRVLLEQLQAIDPERCLGRYVGRVSAEQQQTINHALTSKWVTPPATPPNKATAAEVGEERGRAKGNTASKTRPGHRGLCETPYIY